MQNFLVPILLLAAVALSSSNVLPMLSLGPLNSEQLPYHSQHNDNTYKFQHRNLLKELIYKSTVYNDNPNLRKAMNPNYFGKDNNNFDDNSNLFSKIDQYNGEGFRKEQWHNYPRQLDRLHRYLYEYHDADKRNMDPDNPGNEDYYDKEPNIQNSNLNDMTNELRIDSNMNIQDASNVNANPLLILKIHLACLGHDVENIDVNNNWLTSEEESNNAQRNAADEHVMSNEISSADSMMKVKREDESTGQEKSAENNTFEGKSVQKRIFSLWSRLQSLNKGHELHHRRHMHAFYGMPDGGGGGVLTAETRAILMRPPGSPLRWG